MKTVSLSIIHEVGSGFLPLDDDRSFDENHFQSNQPKSVEKVKYQEYI